MSNRNSNVEHSAGPVKNTTTQLIPVLLRRGKREEFYYVPQCHVCGKPITNFEEANVAVIGWDFIGQPEAALEPLGNLGDAEAFRIPGVAIAAHFDCDEGKSCPWVRLSSVFQKDQRSPMEKMGWGIE